MASAEQGTCFSIPASPSPRIKYNSLGLGSGHLNLCKMQIPTSGPGVGPDPSALLRSSQASAGPRSTMRSKPLMSMRNTRSPHPTTHLALIQDGACRQPLSPSKNLVQKPPPQAQEQGYGSTIGPPSGIPAEPQLPRKICALPTRPPFPAL